MSTSTDRYGIVTTPPEHVSTASDPADVARQLGTLLDDVDHETRWTVVDLHTGDQIGGTFVADTGLPGLTLLADVAALLRNPLSWPGTSCDLWVGHLLPREIRDFGLLSSEGLSVTLADDCLNGFGCLIRGASEH